MHLIALHDSAGWLFTGPKFLYMRSTSLLLKASLSFILPNIKAIKRIGPHNLDVISVLVGSLLGDGFGEREKSGGVRFRFRQSVVRKDYIFWLHNFLHTRGYCSNLLPVIYTQKTGDKVLEYYRFGTYKFTSLLWLYKTFYNHNKKKVIPANIADLLTPLALAILIMDDGTWKNPGVRIATNIVNIPFRNPDGFPLGNSFTKQEVELLSSALYTKFNLYCSLHKKNPGGIPFRNPDGFPLGNSNYQLYIKQESITLLKELVLPYMIPSMHYKLGI